MTPDLIKLKERSGITLVELVAAMGLIAIITALAFSSYFMGTGTFARGNEKSEVQFNIRLAADFITKELRNAVEIRFTPPPAQQADKYDIIYVENDKKLKYRTKDANETDKSGGIFNEPDDLAFGIKVVNGRNILAFSLHGTLGSQTFNLESDVLLNNISDNMDTNGTKYHRIYFKNHTY